eukprot:4201109-Amphidinium_carterae.1
MQASHCIEVCPEVEWEEEMLPVWKQKCQDVEVEENHLALLQAICMTCDVIWQQKDYCMHSLTFIPPPNGSGRGLVLQRLLQLSCCIISLSLSCTGQVARCPCLRAAHLSWIS